ncbi:MAG: MMPL family transporter [Ketobacteraceae bacterium]|nr:MMPL family transporter [Ketobacteraceae bacterium]
MDRFSQLIESHHRIITLVSFVFITLLGFGLVNAQFTSELRAYFSQDNPQLRQFEALENAFNKQDSILFLVIPDNGDIYSESSVTSLARLTDLAWSIPHSRRVISLTNLPKTVATEDEITSNPLLEKHQDWEPGLGERLRQLTLNDPLYESVASRQGNASLVVVPLELPEGDLRSSIRVVESAKTIRDQILAENPHLTIHLNGTVIANYSIEEAVIQDISTLIPASGALIFAVLMLLLRVLSGTLLTMTIITLTTVGTFGLFSWFSVPLTPVSGTIPTVLTVITVADCIHLLITYYHELSLGHSKRRAVRLALRINFMPMLITSVTTAIGLLCLNFSDSPPYRTLGNTVAFGAILAFVLTVVLLPALLMWLPVPARLRATATTSSLNHFRLMENLGQFIIGHNRWILGVTAVIALALSANILQIRVDDQWDKYFDDSFAITDSFAEMENYFGGGHFVDFSAGAGAGQGIYNPDYMRELDSLAIWLQQQPEVGRVDTFSNHIKMLNQALNGGDPAQYRIPDDRELISQAVMLYEMSLPYGMSIEDQVNTDRSATRITAFMDSLSSEEMIEFEQRVQTWANANLSTLELSEGTGIDLVFAHMAQRNSLKLLSGTLLALVLISLILVAVFRSVKLGLLSLVPNIIPVLAAYGVWGLTSGKVDLALSIVGAMSLGLVVDDTIHFLAKYRYARRTLQLRTQDSILYAFKTVGLAMLITSVILCLGFLTLTLSHFHPTWNMGVLLATTISLALVLDFLLLPGLLMLIDRDKTDLPVLDPSTLGGIRTPQNEQHAESTTPG